MSDESQLARPSAPHRSGPREALPTAEQVARFLMRHPDFLVEHAELLESVAPPRRPAGRNVLDLQQAMLGRQSRELTTLRQSQAALIATARANQSTQARVHDAVLRLLAAPTFEHLIQTVTTDLAVVLDVDVVTLCIEAGDRPVPQAYAAAVRALPNGMVDTLLGDGQVRLFADEPGDRVVFGAGAGLVRSACLARLVVSPRGPAGLVAFGARRKDWFHPGQGTELIGFLARVLESVIRSWLDLPAWCEATA